MAEFSPNISYDVVVVGGGNAALCAALSARQHGAKVVILERAGQKDRGGNSYFTDGLMRTVYNGADDIKDLCPDITEQEVSITDFGSYSEANYIDDMARLTNYRTDPDLCEIIVKNSRDTLRWMKSVGVRFLPNYGRQAYKVDGRFKFWGGATVAVADGGPGLIDTLYSAAEQNGIDVCYDAYVNRLICTPEGTSGVEVLFGGQRKTISCSAIILACGSFEANPEWRARYLGPGWDLAKVRGTKYNTGTGIAMALDVGAQPYGHWSGCHATAWERNAQDFGHPQLTPQYQRHSYPLGIVVNIDGARFIDEGADFRNYTYAKYGGAILQQPNQVAWQIFDAKTEHLMRDEYRTRSATKTQAMSIKELATRLDDVNVDRLISTIYTFNNAVQREIEFQPNIKDGRGTQGLEIPKSNWANTIDQPPFTAYAVTCGITFTFGGIKVNVDGSVLGVDDKPIKGLYAAGEMVGGIFFHNYPGASGLTSGAVLGRISGKHAAEFAHVTRH